MGARLLSADLPICAGVFQLRGPLSMLALGEKEVILPQRRRPPTVATLGGNDLPHLPRLRRCGGLALRRRGAPVTLQPIPRTVRRRPESLRSGKRLVCPLWDTESTWLWRRCSRPWNCEGKLISTCRPVLIAGTRHRGSSWRSFGMERWWDGEVVGVGMIICHLMFAVHIRASSRAGGGVDGTRNGQQTAAAMLPKSALSKVVSGQQNLEPGLVPPSSNLWSICVVHGAQI